MKKLFVYLAMFLIVATACNSNKNDEAWIEDEDIDMSDELLLSDESVLTDMPEYSKVRSGESEIIDRSFENAPPLIPHRVGGFLPIKIRPRNLMQYLYPKRILPVTGLS